MLRKSEGFFLAEMFISLAAFMMAVSILLPYAVNISRQTSAVRQGADATEILYDELMFIKITGKESGMNDMMKNGERYQVVVYTEESGKVWEVCVRYGEGNSAEKCAMPQ